MKRRVSLIGALACALCVVCALAGCAQSGSYKAKELTPTISSPTIGENGTLRVGVDMSGGAPFVTTTSTSDPEGFDVDMAAALAQQLGLKLKIVDTKGDASSALSNGTVDIVMSQSSSGKNSSMWVSDPYIETGVALFAPSGTSVPSSPAAASSIAAQSSSTSSWAVGNAFGDDAVNPASDLVSAFSLVETGNATYVAADAVIGTYAALQQNVNVVPIALLGSKGGYCIGVSSSNQNLQTAVSGALSTISSNGISEAICMKWLATTVDLDSLTAIEVSASQSSSKGLSSETTSSSTAGANAVQPGGSTN